MSEVEPFKKHVASICDEWDKAERVVKLAEQTNHKVVYPSIQELRYAGRRLVEALRASDAGDDEEKVLGLLQDAEFNCHRARHDAIDATTAKIALDLDEASRRIGYDAILKAFPDFSLLVGMLEEVRSKIQASRADRRQRESIYRDIENNHFDELIKKYGQFRAAEPIMIELAKKDRRRRFCSYLIGVGGIVVAFFGVLVSLF